VPLEKAVAAWYKDGGVDDKGVLAAPGHPGAGPDALV
jgi:hypothetical protein